MVFEEGTLLAMPSFPPDRYLLEMFQGISIFLIFAESQFCFERCLPLMNAFHLSFSPCRLRLAPLLMLRIMLDFIFLSLFFSSSFSSSLLLPVHAITVSRMMLDSQHVGGGLRTDGVLTAVVADTYFIHYNTRGLWASNERSWDSHEIIVCRNIT